MTSESQERMLAIVTPIRGRGAAHLPPSGSAGHLIGTVMEPSRRASPRIPTAWTAGAGRRPAASLSDDAPSTTAPRHGAGSRADTRHRRAPTRLPATSWPCCLAAGLPPVRSPTVLNTVAGPGADAALLRLAGPGCPRRSAAWHSRRIRTPRLPLDPRGHGARPWPRVSPHWPVSAPHGCGRQLLELPQSRAPRGHGGSSRSASTACRACRAFSLP